ncbi:MAG: DNA repair protein RecO [Gammaproteobacteria bacterium]|nr:DNA repair protein RecO [Gammaproteobacteria bacterium]
MSDRLTVTLADGFLLHSRPYRDSSVIADFFTAEHGRIAVVARGARRPKSRIRGLLQPFQPLLVSWISRGSLGTLTGLEIRPARRHSFGDRVLSAYYLNELIMRALQPGDSQQDVFRLYENCLNAIATDQRTAAVLRCFERDLLQMLGYGLHLAADNDGVPVDDDSVYLFDMQEGPRRVSDGAGSYSGASLNALAQGSFENHSQLNEAKRLLRGAIDFHLGDKNSRVRKVMNSMSHRKRGWRSPLKSTP